MFYMSAALYTSYNWYQPARLVHAAQEMILGKNMHRERKRERGKKEREKEREKE